MQIDKGIKLFLYLEKLAITFGEWLMMSSVMQSAHQFITVA